ncbi:MAG: SGNH/GDSL hydrolase family protein [Telluria sp.]
MLPSRLPILATAAMLALHGPARAEWTPSWFASPQPPWTQTFVLPMGVPAQLADETVFERMRISTGGTGLRVTYSNRYGAVPLRIGAASVRLDGAGRSQALTFGGKPDVVIAPGASAVSDAFRAEVHALSSLTVATWFPRRTQVTTFHWGGQQTAYVESGNRTNAAPRRDAREVKGRMFVSSILVDGARAPVVVALGDSLTDGNGSTPDVNRRWPDQLAERLAKQGVAVANAGISGAQLLGDGMGQNVFARLDGDVLSQPNVATLVVLIGINDIGWPGSPFAPSAPAMDAETLIGGYRQLLERARSHGVRVVLGTLPPFEGALAGTPLEGHYSAAKDGVRRTVNEWIRHASGADAVADFDTLLRDPARPSRLLPAYDSGDHLHPGDAGYAAMARLLDNRMLFGAAAGKE